MTTVPARFAPSRVLTMLVGATATLCVAFVLAPITLAARTSRDKFADQHDIVTHAGAAFVQYWHAGRQTFPPQLAALVDYWSHYHVAKAAIAAILALASVLLAVMLWRAVLRSSGLGRTFALGSSGVAAALLALASAAVVVANIQGAIAPFSSLLSMLPFGSPDASLAGVLDQVRQQLAGGVRSPALAVMIDDDVRYHVVVVVAAAIAAVALIGGGIAAWRWFGAASGKHTRRVAALFGVLSVVSTLIVVVVGVANLTTVADPAPALLGLFNGGS